MTWATQPSPSRPPVTNTATRLTAPTVRLQPTEHVSFTAEHVMMFDDYLAQNFYNRFSVTAAPPANQGPPINGTSNWLEAVVH